MAVNVLLLIATAFLAAALGALATNAQPPLLVLFFAVSAITGGAGITWQSRRFREWLPFAKPWKSRLHALWVEGVALRNAVMQSASVDDVTRAAAIDWENRMWRLVESELGERTAMHRENYGRPEVGLDRSHSNELAANLGTRLDFLQGLARGLIT
jgi:hypothetical protein